MSRTKSFRIPEAVLASAETLDDLYDWLASRNPEFVANLRRIRKQEDLAGQGKDLKELLQRWPIK